MPNPQIWHVLLPVLRIQLNAVLERGYSIATDASGEILRDSRSLEPNDQITVCFHRGRAEATVASVTREAD